METHFAQSLELALTFLQASVVAEVRRRNRLLQCTDAPPAITHTETIPREQVTARYRHGCWSMISYPWIRMRRKRKEGETCLTSFAKGQCLVWVFAICCCSTPATFFAIYSSTPHACDIFGVDCLICYNTGSKAGRHTDLGYPYSFLILVSSHLREEDDFLMYSFREERF